MFAKGCDSIDRRNALANQSPTETNMTSFQATDNHRIDPTPTIAIQTLIRSFDLPIPDSRCQEILDQTNTPELF